MSFEIKETHAHISYYNKFIRPYQIVLERIQRRLEVFQNSKEIAPGHNPIHTINARIKTLPSMAEKLKRYEHEVSFESAHENLHDIAGVRVVCYFLDDLKTVTDEIHRFDDCIVIKDRDYTTNGAKASGYRSYHMVLEVPVDASNPRDRYPVEIQLRTLAMEFWASIEHELRYKNKDFDQQLVADELKAYSEILHDIDTRIAGFYDLHLAAQEARLTAAQGFEEEIGAQ